MKPQESYQKSRTTQNKCKAETVAVAYYLSLHYYLIITTPLLIAISLSPLLLLPAPTFESLSLSLSCFYQTRFPSPKPSFLNHGGEALAGATSGGPRAIPPQTLHFRTT